MTHQKPPCCRSMDFAFSNLWGHPHTHWAFEIAPPIPSLGSCSLGSYALVAPWKTTVPLALPSAYSPFPHTCFGLVHYLQFKCMICP